MKIKKLKKKLKKKLLHNEFKEKDIENYNPQRSFVISCTFCEPLGINQCYVLTYKEKLLGGYCSGCKTFSFIEDMGIKPVKKKAVKALVKYQNKILREMKL